MCFSFDFDAEPSVEEKIELVKPPIAEDEIAEADIERLAQLPVEVEQEPMAAETAAESAEEADRQWQIIDQLPPVAASENNTKTVQEFMNELRDLHKQRIDRHIGNNTDN